MFPRFSTISRDRKFNFLSQIQPLIFDTYTHTYIEVTNEIVLLSLLCILCYSVACASVPELTVCYNLITEVTLWLTGPHCSITLIWIHFFCPLPSPLMLFSWKEGVWGLSCFCLIRMKANQKCVKSLFIHEELVLCMIKPLVELMWLNQTVFINSYLDYLSFGHWHWFLFCICFLFSYRSSVTGDGARHQQPPWVSVSEYDRARLGR